MICALSLLSADNLINGVVISHEIYLLYANQQH
jgi:hypothetical protein